MQLQVSPAQLLNYRISAILQERRSGGKHMKESVLVTSRGQITLPAGVRKRLGIKAGGVVLLEERNGEVVLRPAAVLEIENYPDEDIANWDKEDRLTESARAAIIKKTSRRK
jgi:AbrB family looped-hinge helix DNA binding protein